MQIYSYFNSTTIKVYLSNVPPSISSLAYVYSLPVKCRWIEHKGGKHWKNLFMVDYFESFRGKMQFFFQCLLSMFHLNAYRSLVLRMMDWAPSNCWKFCCLDLSLLQEPWMTLYLFWICLLLLINICDFGSNPSKGPGVPKSP